MLDVVFILLIFFIVTATFVQERAIGLEPPPPPPPPDQPQQETPTIRIFVNADSLIRVNGRPTDIGSVRPNIERLKAENPDSAVIIQAEPDARSGLIINIRDQVYEAQATPVNVLLSGGEG